MALRRGGSGGLVHAAAVAGGSLRVSVVFAGAAGVVWRSFPAGHVAGGVVFDGGISAAVAG